MTSGESREPRAGGGALPGPGGSHLTTLRTWDFLLATVPQATVHTELCPSCSWPCLAGRVGRDKGALARECFCGSGPGEASAQHWAGRGGGVHLPHQLGTVPAVGSRAPTWAAMPPRPAASPPLLACVPVVHVMDS